ncbi:DUF2799 domain-containing protein [Photobacterium aquae]|uniref:DUF2799 domain-containing protein n=1 Tax=Photobacterium aquae TaxID=1195763 RepID=UPI00069F6CC4|nr:DUF2799 domain-containing protein [Photobacterium aquae]
MKYLVLSLAILGLAACTGQNYDTELAQENQWEQLGLKDGETGRLIRSEKDLARLHTLNENAVAEYNVGYKMGIEQYCLPFNTYKQGKKGTQYTGQCLNTSHERLAVQGWETGYKEYIAEHDMLWLNNE